MPVRDKGETPFGQLFANAILGLRDKKGTLSKQI